MDEIQSLLRYSWQTEIIDYCGKRYGNGSNGSYNCHAEPGDVVLVGVAGCFGNRLC